MGNKSKRGRWALRKVHTDGIKIYIWAPKGGTRKKRRRQKGMDELPELLECSREAYEKWKAELAEKGKIPTDAVAYCRSIGMKAYAETLEEVIGKYEDAPGETDAESKEAYLAERREKRRRQNRQDKSAT